MYVQDELSYDRFHDRADRIYRLFVDIFPPNDGPVDHYATSGPGVGPTLERDFPEVERAVRIWANRSLLFKRDQDLFYEKTGIFSKRLYFKARRAEET